MRSMYALTNSKETKNDHARHDLEFHYLARLVWRSVASDDALRAFLDRVREVFRISISRRIERARLTPALFFFITNTKDSKMKCFQKAARYGRSLAASVAAVLAIVLTTSASAQVTLPDTGVDISGFVTAAIVALGTVVAVVVGGFFAFRLIQWGLTWAGSRTKG